MLPTTYSAPQSTLRESVNAISVVSQASGVGDGDGGGGVGVGVGVGGGRDQGGGGRPLKEREREGGGERERCPVAKLASDGPSGRRVRLWWIDNRCIETLPYQPPPAKKLHKLHVHKGHSRRWRRALRDLRPWPSSSSSWSSCPWRRPASRRRGRTRRRRRKRTRRLTRRTRPIDTTRNTMEIITVGRAERELSGQKYLLVRFFFPSPDRGVRR